jgi:hypothetical protein
VALVAYFALATLFALLLAGISIHANRSLPNSAELPMQWGFDGRPTWSAPRKLALAFMPALYSLTMLAIAFLIPVQWEPDVPAMLGVMTVVATAFVAAHLFHIWLIRRGG